MKKLKTLKNELLDLQSHPDPDQGTYESSGWIIREAAEVAAQHGRIDLYEQYKNVRHCSPRDGLAILAHIEYEIKPKPSDSESDPGSEHGPFSVSQVADRLGISKSMVYQDAQSGILPHKRIGRRILINLDQLDTYRSIIEAEPLTVKMEFRHLS